MSSSVNKNFIIIITIIIIIGGKGVGGVDGGIRVPGLFRWPGVIHPGSVTDTVTTQLDILPLIAAITNIPLPGDREIDGKDIVPVLQGKITRSPYEFVFHYCDGVIVAVRYMPQGGKCYSLCSYKKMSYDLELENSRLQNKVYGYCTIVSKGFVSHNSFYPDFNDVTQGYIYK